MGSKLEARVKGGVVDCDREVEGEIWKDRWNSVQQDNTVENCDVTWM